MKKSIRVLIIDDDEEDFMIIKDLLNEIPEREYHIEWVSSFQEGINEISRKKHDIYFVDYRLGIDEENGLNVIRECVRRGCQAPMIILTGQLNSDIDEEGMKSGAHDFLVKGQFTARDLERAIRYSMNHAGNILEIQNLNVELERRVEERTKGLHNALVELEKSKKDVEQALNKERELNELKSRFVTMASHEFRTPLSTIMSSMDLISKYATDDLLDKRLKHIDRVRTSVRHLTCLLEDFLSLGKLEEGVIQINLQPCDLKLLCVQIISEMQSLARNNQVIWFDYSGVEKPVLLDAKIVKNILINLLSNAIKFSPEGKEIQVKVMNRENEVEITVRDQGIGIPESDQKHMFRRFFRAGNAINVQGTGLGLNIVSKYVEMLRGQISFTSRYGENTVFRVLFPSQTNA